MGQRRIDLPVVADTHGRRNISPTDVAQFIRLEQCQRYLRLWLHERTVNARFMADYMPAAHRFAQPLTPQASEEDALARDAILQGRS